MCKMDLVIEGSVLHLQQLHLKNQTKKQRIILFKNSKFTV